MTFIRRKVVNGRVYLSEEERYRENGKVKSRYIRSLTNMGHFQGEVAAHDAMEKVANEQAAREAAYEHQWTPQMTDDDTDVEGCEDCLATREAPSAASKEPSEQDSKDVSEGDVGEAGGDKGGDVSDGGDKGTTD